MFRWIYKKIRLWSLYNQFENKTGGDDGNKPEAVLVKPLNKNLALFKDIMGNSTDFIVREFSFGVNGRLKSAVLYLEGLTNTKLLNENIIKPLMYDVKIAYEKKMKFELKDIDNIMESLLTVSDVKKAEQINEITGALLSGYTVLLIDGCSKALVANAKEWEKRAIDKPETDNTVRGPREGFSETLLVNISLLRRKIKNPQLVLEKMTIGEQTKTDVCIAYLKNIANHKVVDEVRNRIERIKTDAILESGYIEQFIEDAPFSVFATIANTERPDVAAARMLSGRVAILVDGTPFVLTAPALFIESFQSAEDYYFRPYFTSMLRIIRFLSYAISVLLPSIYVALSSFHQQLIPTPLLFTMTSAREGIPFPAPVEAGMMIVVFEILREAGVRLPTPVGQAVSIVGALVLGETAVSAGFIGAPMVIVIALTAVSGFVVSSQTDTISILRLIFLLLSAILGAFGIVMGLLGLLVHLSTLRSFGTPFFSPFAPLVPADLKDSVIRMPIWALLTRPKLIVQDNIKKEEEGLKPGPHQNR